jgi:hypothetical protein
MTNQIPENLEKKGLSDNPSLLRKHGKSSGNGMIREYISPSW